MTVWMTPKEAGEYIGTSAEMIRDAVKRGDLPASRIGKGRDYRVTQDAVDRWMWDNPWEPRASA